MLSGDVESNPGPNSGQTSKSNRPQCPECCKTVRCTSKQLLCTTCKSVTHLNCAKINITIKFLNNSEPKQWLCTCCTLSSLPFHSLRSLAELSNDNINICDDSCIKPDIHLQCLEQFPNHTSICHLNTQCICSTFDEFYVMCNTYKYDIITLSETWLKTIIT